MQEFKASELIPLVKWIFHNNPGRLRNNVELTRDTLDVFAISSFATYGKKKEKKQ